MNAVFDNRILGLEIAKLKADIIFLGPDGSALHDNYDTLDGVDLSLTENVDFSTQGILKNIVAASGPIIPDMTGNSALSPFIVTSADDDTWSGGGERWKAFDRDNNTGWYNDAVPSWIAIDCGVQKSVGSFTIRTRHNSSSTHNGFPVAFGFYGSNDGTSWTLIESFSGISWANGETKNFVLSSAANYRHFKLNITAGSTNNVIISEWQLYPPESCEDIVIVSKCVESDVVPTSMRCALIADYEGTVNTDFNIYVSRVDGQEWTKAVAVELYRNQDGYLVIDTGDVDVTAQASGSDLRYKIETANAIICQIDGVALWGQE
jgi:hypothetical protein